jgi:large subunit ribosomal protein L10
MPTQRKIDEVEQLTDLLSRSTVVVGADYRGLSVKDSTTLRRQLDEAQIDMRVVKNTLFLRAAEAAGKTAVVELADGPTALIFGFGDPIAPIKMLVEYQRTARNTFAARKAFLDGTVFPGNRLAELATLPSKDELIAQFAGAIQSPIAELVGLLQGTIQEFAGLIDARAEQLEGKAA